MDYEMEFQEFPCKIGAGDWLARAGMTDTQSMCERALGQRPEDGVTVVSPLPDATIRAL